MAKKMLLNSKSSISKRILIQILCIEKNHFKFSKNALNNLWQHIAFHVILTIRMSTKLFHKFCKSMFFYPLKAHDWLDVILNLLLFWMIYHIYHISEKKICLSLHFLRRPQMFEKMSQFYLTLLTKLKKSWEISKISRVLWINPWSQYYSDR